MTKLTSVPDQMNQCAQKLRLLDSDHIRLIVFLAYVRTQGCLNFTISIYSLDTSTLIITFLNVAVTGSLFNLTMICFRGHTTSAWGVIRVF